MRASRVLKKSSSSHTCSGRPRSWRWCTLEIRQRRPVWKPVTHEVAGPDTSTCPPWAIPRSRGAPDHCLAVVCETIAAGPSTYACVVPLYMDRHDAPGITPEELADAHTRDVDVQEKRGVRYHTYWFDPANGSVFCLAEGPSKQALEAVHQEAHGLRAGTILELNPNVPLNELLGPRPEFPLGTPYAAPAMRAIVFTDLAGSVEQTSRLGDDGHLEVLRVHNKIIRDELSTRGGREVKHTGDGIMAAFTSVASAVAFAIAAQRAFHDYNQSSALPLDVKIGISAGEPVTDGNDDLFGAAVQLAARLCAFAAAGEIAASVAVRELSVGKQFRFEHRGLVQIKGLPEPITAYRVSWRDDD
jgi:class 3 adenylate cyclase